MPCICDVNICFPMVLSDPPPHERVVRHFQVDREVSDLCIEASGVSILGKASRWILRGYRIPEPDSTFSACLDLLEQRDCPSLQRCSGDSITLKVASVLWCVHWWPPHPSRVWTSIQTLVWPVIGVYRLHKTGCRVVVGCCSLAFGPKGRDCFLTGSGDPEEHRVAATRRLAVPTVTSLLLALLGRVFRNKARNVEEIQFSPGVWLS